MAPHKRMSTSYSSHSRSNRLTTATGTRTGTATRTQTSNQLTSLSNPSFNTGTGEYATTFSRPRTGKSAGRPTTARPRTGVSTLGVENQEIICAVSESRGIAPTVGLAFVNLDTGEAVLSQLNDSQTYVRTLHKLHVFNPTTILIVSTATNPNAKLFSIIEENLDDLGSNITLLDRRYWAENTGIEYIKQLAFIEDVESITTAVEGNYYAVCCFAAVLKYVELALSKTFPSRGLRIRYEPSEGSMMIDLSTIRSLELVQNLQVPKSKDCLFGLLNETLTPMGSRLLRSNILQPLTNPETLNGRYDALEELSTKEDMFFAVRQALKPFQDADKMLTQLILVPTVDDLKIKEQSVNNIILLKQFVSLIKPVFEALTGARTDMLQDIRGLCASEHIEPIQEIIDTVINSDATFAAKPLDMRNQRTYAVKSGVNGFLDVARMTYKEAMSDALQHVSDLSEEHGLQLQTKFDNVRQFYLQLSASELDDRNLPPVFINVFRKKDNIECQTLDLMKRNQKIADAHNEVMMMSDKSVQNLVDSIREHMSALFKISEAVAMLDMLSSFAQLLTSQGYCRPVISETLGIRGGRHPIREKIQSTKFIPNDVYATQQARFQIITGCNMSGKSTYIRSVALIIVMAQIGCFAPADYASFPIMRQLFARVSMDDNIEANVSTFAAEMRETAFILRNIDRQSIAIIDELGRGTSTRDGLAIALAIAEALVESRALVWFATHFRDLSTIMAERNGVANLHLAVNSTEDNKMEMLYRIAHGTVEEEHYGLKLAKVVPLPLDVLGHAEHVSHALEQQTKRRQKRSPQLIQVRRRRLLLNLREHLIQAKDGAMQNDQLSHWLKALQKEFVNRMTALDEEERNAELGIYDEGDDEQDEDGESQVPDGGHSRPGTQGSFGERAERQLQGELDEASSWRDREGIENVDATEDVAESDVWRTVEASVGGSVHDQG